MGYRWKPNKAQKQAYIERLKEREEVRPTGTPYAIRKGCKVEYYSLNKGEIIKGEVIKDSYGAEKGQHTFTILQHDGCAVLVKGRNLYPNIIRHIQGEISKNLN